MKKDLKETAAKLHEEYKDHEKVEAAEKWWKSKPTMFKAILVFAVVMIGYNVLFGA